MELFDRVVTETVRSGIEPLQLTFVGICDCYSARPVAYRTETEIFCSATGKVSDAYVEKTDLTETGVALTYRNLKKAARCVKALTEAGRKTNWVSVRGATSFLLQNDVYASLKKFFEEENFSETGKLCVEFSKSVFAADRERVRKGIADLKVLGVRTLLGDFASDGFPTSALLDVSVDAVVLAPEITALALDRNKPGVLASLIRFLRSMDVQIVAEGVENDEQLRELNKAECFGFIPSARYQGRYAVTGERRDFASVLADAEDM